MDLKPTKVIIPVAGYGTRRLPITKSIEKCMMPIGNKPIIDFVVEDCIKAGIEEIIFVVSEQSQQLRNYYSHNYELEDYLKTNGKDNLIEIIRPPENIRFNYVIQTKDDPYGTTVPVWLCREFVQANEQIVVIMGDQFFYREDGGSNVADLINLVQKNGVKSGLLGVNVPKEDVQKYGVIEIDENGLYKRIVEHPKPEESPSTLNNASMYLFEAKMFDYFDKDIKTPRSGEYMIIDPINNYVNDGNKIIVGEAKGTYLDGGTVEGWLHANDFIASHQIDNFS